MIAIKTLIKRMKKNIWIPPGVPPEAIPEDYEVNAIPKEFLDIIDEYTGPLGELEERPIISEFKMQVIEYSAEKNEYEIVQHNANQYFDEHWVIAVGIIGAFVPECTREVAYDWACAADSYDKRFDINKVLLVSRNDPYVMLRFAQKLGYKGKISYLADWDGAFNQYIGMDMEHKLELGVRNHRYLAFLHSGSLRVVHKSEYSNLFYSKCIHPIFIWWRLMGRRKIPIYFG